MDSFESILHGRGLIRKDLGLSLDDIVGDPHPQSTPITTCGDQFMTKSYSLYCLDGRGSKRFEIVNRCERHSKRICIYIYAHTQTSIKKGLHNLIQRLYHGKWG